MKISSFWFNWQYKYLSIAIRVPSFHVNEVVPLGNPVGQYLAVWPMQSFMDVSCRATILAYKILIGSLTDTDSSNIWQKDFDGWSLCFTIYTAQIIHHFQNFRWVKFWLSNWKTLKFPHQVFVLYSSSFNTLNQVVMFSLSFVFSLVSLQFQLHH